MMSPLSVSLFLEAEAYQFDTVIFDEASQVCTENAIGAISRESRLLLPGIANNCRQPISLRPQHPPMLITILRTKMRILMHMSPFSMKPTFCQREPYFGITGVAMNILSPFPMRRFIKQPHHISCKY